MVNRLFNRNYNKIDETERLEIIERSTKQVSRGVFYSTIIIIASFLPVFMLTGQEGKLFHPLAYTKTFILIVDAVLVGRATEHDEGLQPPEGVAHQSSEATWTAKATRIARPHRRAARISRRVDIDTRR